MTDNDKSDVVFGSTEGRRDRRSDDFRWKILIYPSMIAFLILSFYGFFLIKSILIQLSAMTGHMDNMAHSMAVMQNTMVAMKGDMGMMSSTVVNMNQNMNSITTNTANMTRYTQSIAASTIEMSRNTKTMIVIASKMGNMDRSFKDIIREIEKTNVGIYGMNRNMNDMNRDTNKMSRPFNFFKWMPTP